MVARQHGQSKDRPVVMMGCHTRHAGCAPTIPQVQLTAPECADCVCVVLPHRQYALGEQFHGWPGVRDVLQVDSAGIHCHNVLPRHPAPQAVAPSLPRHESLSQPVHQPLHRCGRSVLPLVVMHVGMDGAARVEDKGSGARRPKHDTLLTW